ncbi:hypothetical protein VNI00_016935 [Paramarasmius palmivorus]|uniref:Uncharacterized protein n=1 Tax=Paramarasmius palmivorus TaxID=297713 RepID=A0AAW0BD18_9AGAR
MPWVDKKDHKTERPRYVEVDDDDPGIQEGGRVPEDYSLVWVEPPFRPMAYVWEEMDLEFLQNLIANYWGLPGKVTSGPFPYSVHRLRPRPGRKAYLHHNELTDNEYRRREEMVEVLTRRELAREAEQKITKKEVKAEFD